MRRARSSTRDTSSSVSRRGLRARRPRRPRLQRQAPVLQLPQGEGNGASLQAAQVSDACGFVAAGDLAAARAGAAAGMRDRRSLMVGVGCSDPMDLPRARGHAVHGRTSSRRRDRDQIGAADRRRGRVESRRARAVSQRLLEAALSRSDKILGKTTEDARPQDLVGSGVLPEIVPQPAAYFIERRDGLRLTLLMLNGAVPGLHVCLPAQGAIDPLDAVFLTPTPNVTYSASLGSKIEEMFATGVALPGRADADRLRNSRELPRLQSRRAQPAGDAASRRHVPAPAQSQFCRA